MFFTPLDSNAGHISHETSKIGHFLKPLKFSQTISVLLFFCFCFLCFDLRFLIGKSANALCRLTRCPNFIPKIFSDSTDLLKYLFTKKPEEKLKPKRQDRFEASMLWKKLKNGGGHDLFEKFRLELHYFFWWNVRRHHGG